MDLILYLCSMKKNKCASVIIINKETGLILAVSRKDNHSIFSLPGGKFENRDTYPIFTATRELFEEVGLKRKIDQLVLVDKIFREDTNTDEFFYTTHYDGETLSSDEPHIIKWCTPEEIMAGPFGEINGEVFKKLGLVV